MSAPADSKRARASSARGGRVVATGHARAASARDVGFPDELPLEPDASPAAVPASTSRRDRIALLGAGLLVGLIAGWVAWKVTAFVYYSFLF